MTIKLIIDTREHDLLEQCKKTIEYTPRLSSIIVETEMLPLGDIIIRSETQQMDNDKSNDTTPKYKELIIFERKTIKDLVSSIKDGRYSEQSFRLSNLPHPNHNIVYLIEGDIASFNSFKEKTNLQTIYSAIFSLCYYKGFSVMRTTSIAETANVLCNIITKMASESLKKPYYSADLEDGTTAMQVGSVSIPPEPSDPSLSYCHAIKKHKKNNITPENIGEIMLCQIPGVSSATSKELCKNLEQFQT